MKKGLDNRSEDKNGRIREKNGASKMGNLSKEYPILKVFNRDATLTGIKQRHQLKSLDEVIKFAQKKSK